MKAPIQLPQSEVAAELLPEFERLRTRFPSGFDSSLLLPETRVPIHAVAYSQDVQTPPRRVREVAELAADGHFHLLEGLGHGSAFGHRPDEVNACLRAIIDGYFQG